MTDTAVPVTTKKDWSSDQEVRWCPGCGDYSILTAVQLLMPELDVRREDMVFVSGIGCAARFPYYMNTYGMHAIHGRAPAVATGLAVARPDLHVWVVTGDGDGLSIGGNHLIHALRRNVNITILLFNNQIYGLTKGQYSPTSEVGQGHQVDAVRLARPPVQPHQPGARAPRPPSWRAPTTWTASTCMATFKRAHEHRGAAFVEIYQNCNVFNDGAFEQILGQGGPADEPHPPPPRRAHPLRPRRTRRASCSTARDGRASSTWPTWARTRSSCTTSSATSRGSRSCCRAWHAGPTSRRPSACSAPSTVPSTATRSTASCSPRSERQGPGDLADAVALRPAPGRSERRPASARHAA